MRWEELTDGLKLEAGAGVEPINAAAQSLDIVFPEDYVQFMRVSNGAEGSVADRSYLQLWKIDAIISLNKEYGVQEFAPDLVLFGSDGGGEAYAFRRLHDGVDIVQVPFVGLGMEPPIVRGRTFGEFLEYLHGGKG